MRADFRSGCKGGEKLAGCASIRGMTVGLSISGVAGSKEAVEKILAEARGWAADMEWSVEEVHHHYPHATLKRADGEEVPMEATEVRGVALIPHFACEGIPFLFLPDGTLVDGYVEDGKGNVPTLYPLALIKTHFAGPVVHAEICDFLKDIKEQAFPGLEVDDETGYYASGDKSALEATFLEAWEELRRRIDDPSRAPGTPFDVGEFPFEVPHGPVGDEYVAIPADTKATIETLSAEFVTAHGTPSTKLDRSRDSLWDLELLVDDQALAMEGPDDLEDEELQAWAHGAGAYLGRTVIHLLGGEWWVEPDEGLLIRNVGNSGLIINPFRAIAERLAFKGPWNLRYQFEVWESLSRALGPRP